MSEHVDKLKDEYVDLRVSIDELKLHRLTVIDEQEELRIIAQLGHMENHLRVLDTRIYFAQEGGK